MLIMMQKYRSNTNIHDSRDLYFLYISHFEAYNVSQGFDIKSDIGYVNIYTNI